MKPKDRRMKAEMKAENLLSASDANEDVSPPGSGRTERRISTSFRSDKGNFTGPLPNKEQDSRDEA
ncbi:hypothetical protein C8P63_1176 [Melghirimyces profundicolus]|uniref:Uncharacterized protein n=1 Tax=Melghirimyces profundicolus TaxID=1242148 RepID=A0A2T6BQD4_9BACL|nr:hypothetical protein [Melghirimyces profundicolus]PTX58259.1 hypothetical protein C8P63_1176 [Melghirimyces profundicolus]